MEVITAVHAQRTALRLAEEIGNLMLYKTWDNTSVDFSKQCAKDTAEVLDKLYGQVVQLLATV